MSGMPWEDFKPQASGPWDDFKSQDQSASTLQEQSSNTGLQDIADKIQGTMVPLGQASDAVARGASNLMFGSEKPAEYVEQGLGAVGQGIQKLGEGVAGGTGYVAQKLANMTGAGGENMAPTDYAAATAGMATSLIPQLLLSKYLAGKPTESPPNELPLDVAQAREARTGVPARDFQRLHKDPGAIFAGGNISQAGANIGAAKTAVGINPGVTNDLSSLTPENIERINPTKATKIDDINLALSKIQGGNTTNELPVIQPGAKEGDPHALFAYNDNFGPNSTPRSLYNVFGDPNHPDIQARGWGSSISAEDAQKAGIPITGRQPNSTQYQPIGLPSKLTPQEAQNALDSVNSILSQPGIQNNRDVFRQWSAIKTHLNDALGEVAPDVREANAAYAREKLGQTFAPMNAVNKSGTPSKLGMLAQKVPGAVGASIGGAIGGIPGAAIGYEGGQALSGLYHAPYIAGLQTAAGSIANRMIGPTLAATERNIPGPLLQAYLSRYGRKSQ